MKRRTERLADEIRQQVALMIAKELKDPRLGFVTITRVELADDLGFARVYVGVLGGEAERAKTLEGLKQAAGYIRRQLGRRLRTHKTPEFVFQYDTGLDATDRVARLLAEVDAQPRSTDVAPAAPEAEGGSVPEPEPSDEP